MPITIEKIDDTTFKVTVADRTTTTHVVTVAPEYWQKLTGGSVSAEKLVEKSFEFLLEHEHTLRLRTAGNPALLPGVREDDPHNA